MELFPAQAGVILLVICFIVFQDPFPRTGGGDPKSHYAFYVLMNFSPHRRG